MKKEQWDDVSKKLEYGFEQVGSSFDELAHAWRFITNHKINYEYSKDDLWKNQLKSSILCEDDAPLTAEEGENDEDERNVLGLYDTASDDFFHFNLIAKEIRDAVIE